jgi:hypothetical protein
MRCSLEEFSLHQVGQVYLSYCPVYVSLCVQFLVRTLNLITGFGPGIPSPPLISTERTGGYIQTNNHWNAVM